MNYVSKGINEHKEPFFFIATIIMTVKVLLDFNAILEMPDLIDNIMIAMSILFYLIDIFYTRYYTFREILIGTIASILIFYTCMITKNYYLIMSYILIIASIKKDTKKVVALIYKTKIWYIFFLITIYITLCICTNLIDGEILKDGRIALSLGFTHPNTAGIILFWIIVDKVYLNYEYIDLKKIINLIFEILLIYLVTGCKTSFYMGSIFLMLIIIDKKKKVLFIKNIAKYIFVVSCIFIIISISIYMNKSGIFYNLIYNIDAIMTGRIRIGSKLLSIYGWSLFGQSVKLGNTMYDPYYGLTWVTIDGMYIDLFIRSGIIYMLIIGFLNYKYCNKERPGIDYIVIILFSIYGLSEIHGLYISISFPLLLVSTDYFKRNKRLNQCK